MEKTTYYVIKPTLHDKVKVSVTIQLLNSY
ncbi:hypothetical protein BMETH_9311872316, partial [methanotrophic bacterial endosymbiont of Bathymodiolus sp.]